MAFFTKLLKYVHFFFVSDNQHHFAVVVLFHDHILFLIGVFKLSFRFENDETSPRYYDPLHPEDYCYEILSRPVVKTNTE